MRLIWLGLALLGGCGAVQGSSVRPDYETEDATKTVRLAVVTASTTPAAPLWSRIARRYANHHRDFIAKEEHVAQTPLERCTDGIEGVLWLKPVARLEGEGAQLSTHAQLLRCRDGQEVWRAQGGGSWPSADPTIFELRRQYVEELGASVEPWVAPVFHLLRAVLDTLPKPRLDEDGIMEKIELGE